MAAVVAMGLTYGRVNDRSNVKVVKEYSRRKLVLLKGGEGESGHLHLGPTELGFSSFFFFLFTQK